MPRSPRQSRPRGDLLYDKPPLAHEALVQRLVDRGMVVPDVTRAERYLRHIGYYRLSPYTIPFQLGRPDHQFRGGTQFDEVLDLYVDRALRLLVLDALERVEVAVRAALTDHMSTTYGDPHWYRDQSHFADGARQSKLLQIVRETCADHLRRSPESATDALVHRSALEHYLTTYGEPELPPSWLMVESLTIGQLASTIRNLRRRSDRTAIARSVGLNETLLQSWLLTYVRVRNVCAHHGRLWNLGLGVYPAIPDSPAIAWLESEASLPRRSQKRLYPVLVSLQTMLTTVSPHSSWAQRLNALVSARPAMNLAGMGIPEGWSDDAFWQRHLS